MKKLLKSITLLVSLSIIISCAEPTYNKSGFEIETKTVNKIAILEYKDYEKMVRTLSLRIVFPNEPYYSGGYKFKNGPYSETIFKMNKELWLRIKYQADYFEYDEIFDINRQMVDCWKKNKSVCNIN